MLPGRRRTDSHYVQERTGLRHHVATSLEERAVAIINDAIAVFPFAGTESGGPGSHNRLAALILQSLAAAARQGELDPRSEPVGDLRHAAESSDVGVRQLFELVYVIERAALEKLALDASFGAAAEPWRAVAQIVRRSSFDLLAAYSDRLNREPGRDALLDTLTTLHTRAVVVAATEKEIQRAERYGHPFALILVDVDRMAGINAMHGYGSGDRVLERLGILMRNYFREQDWVGRFFGDGFAVLLPETGREHAAHLAERVRTTVEGRIALHDYHSDEQVAVTVSAAVVFVETVDRTVRAEQLFDEAQLALKRAKDAGRNRLEKVDLAFPRASAPPPALHPLG
jgi:diguanylate cyclase (GGDEF)-like protein